VFHHGQVDRTDKELSLIPGGYTGIMADSPAHRDELVTYRILAAGAIEVKRGSAATRNVTLKNTISQRELGFFISTKIERAVTLVML
jgi:hypothetical protein